VEERAVRESQVVLSQNMGIADANLAGFVHGGVIMKLVDDAAGLAAIRHSRGPVVTAAVDEMSFIEPVQLGSLVTVKASLNDVGTSSMEVGVRVETEDILTGERAHTSSAYLVFVALDQDTGKPREVPRLVAETPAEKRRMREAQIRRETRLARRHRILEARAAGEDAV
jgi:acyl-CoA hydrolase